MDQRHALTALLISAAAVQSCAPSGSAPASPSGEVAAPNRIAFVSKRDGDAEIYAVNTDGSELRRLTRSRGDDLGPSWSPTGDRLAFVSARGGGPDVFIMDPDGANVQRVTHGGRAGMFTSWSPDGTHIAYDTRTGIEVVSLNTGDTTRLTDDGMAPSWSPDGTRILFNRGQIPQIMIMRSDGSDARMLCAGPSDPLPDLGPVWAPDGERILFSAVHASMGKMTYTLYTCRPDGQQAERVIRSTGRDMAGDWAPDGTRMVFTSDRDGNQDIYVVDADGSNLARLTDHPAEDAMPSWSPTM
ncbi:MAG: hypothetical protein GY715_13110 [Planctomycetes bacterium]|nr:hypothetical protein [Planctomycetota bacterium]